MTVGLKGPRQPLGLAGLRYVAICLVGLRTVISTERVFSWRVRLSPPFLKPNSSGAAIKAVT